MNATFDSFARNYEEACQQGLALTGERRDFFARARARITGQFVRRRNVAITRILDFGCGIGHTSLLLQEEFPGACVVGVDCSHDSIDRADQIYTDASLQFVTALETADYQSFDLAYCNGVFHHIPLPERDSQFQLVFAALKPGGLFALWENNPWNPGTRLVMSRIPFDRDAILLSAYESGQMLAKAGFQRLGTSFHFYFPSILRAFRPLEPALAWLPLGGQYCVLAAKP